MYVARLLGDLCMERVPIAIGKEEINDMLTP